ncbi:hypothetical protein L1987_78887 [Smallanthus sonchifolius]|uniref:Uncharacterized protein n=1 Tax=Smallanthus sonchifolius TaxID=185202 RepID=A0ACB8ZDW4_9ASTR|nr:hypothetical protein L1987_78887 [Smallanthus sonchifolius]
MERLRDRNEDRSDYEDKYRRRRDGDKFRSERDSQDRRGRDKNRSDDEGDNDRRRRDRNRDRRNGDGYVDDRRGDRRREGANEDGDDKRRDQKKDKGSDDEYDNDTRRDRGRVLRGDDEYRNDRRNKERNENRRRSRSRSVEDDANDRRKQREDGKKSVRHDQSDEEIAEIRKSEKHEDKKDEEDGEIRKVERKGKHEEDSEIRKRGTKDKDRRSDDEYDYKDRRRRDMNKNMSDDEDDKYKKRRDDDSRRRDVTSDEDDGNGKSSRKKSEGSKRSVRHDQSDEEFGEFRKLGRKHEKSDDEDGEIRKTVRKGKHEDRSDDEDDEIRKRGRKGKDRRSDDEDDRKDRRRRDRNKNRSDDEDDKYKKRRDGDGRRRDGKRDRRSNGDHKVRRRSDDMLNQKSDKNGASENLDEGPRFQKLAEMQEGMTNLGKSGGVYIPPFKLARMMSEVQDKSSMEYQRMTWDALRKSINGLVNKVNATNIKNIIPELFAENLIRGRGLFCRSCMKSQMASPGFTDVFAALVAVVNTKFPEVGDLLLRRIILQLQRAYKRNDKHQLLAAVKFIAHLVNQQVVHELIALELLTLLLENPTDDSVEVAVGFVTECGSILQDLSPKGLHGIFERFRGILHEGEIDKRVQFLIEGLFALRKAKFQGHPAIRPELDLVELEDQLTHEVSLLDKIEPEIALDIFKMDPDFIENEKRYEDVKKTVLGDESSEEEEEGGEDSDDEEDESSEEEDEEQMRIRDETETNLVNLRRTIYLTIMSSVDFEEAGHKLLKIKLEPGQEMELCIMLLECCSQERTYLRYYGLLGQRFCMINKVHQENFEKCFVQQYSMIHRLETNKLRNVAKFFAHLLGTDALPWHVLAYIRLTEEDTTSSSRIFIKILFQELSEHLGIRLLNERLSDPSMQADFESIFPRDNPKNTRFSINFFTSIGLGGITENLREYLKNMPRLIMQQKPASESDGSDSSSSGSESSSSESSSESSDSESDHKSSKRRRRR